MRKHNFEHTAETGVAPFVTNTSTVHEHSEEGQAGGGKNGGFVEVGTGAGTGVIEN